MSEIKLKVSNLLSYPEAAKMLGVSRVTIYAMVKRGELHPFRISNRQYLLKEEIERLKK